jgi:cysteine-rich repeat protein
VIFYSLLNDKTTSVTIGKYYYTPLNFEGWQTMRFILRNIDSGGVFSIEHELQIYDAGGNIVTITMPNSYTPIVYSQITDKTFGAGNFNVNVMLYHMVGLFSEIWIADSYGDWFQSAPSTRVAFITAHSLLFSNYWVLSANNFFNGFTNFNPWLITPSVNPGSNTYFFNSFTYSEPYPTQRGWALLKKDTWLHTGFLEFNNLDQYSFGFKLFPIDKKFYFEVYMYDDESTYPYVFSFTDKDIRMHNPPGYSNTVKLAAQKWNRVVISFSGTQFFNMMRVSIYVSTLLNEIDYSTTVDVFEVLASRSYYTLKEDKILIGFYKDGIIVSELAYFKYAVTDKHLKDLGAFHETGNFNYDFQQNFYSDYYKYFDNKKKDFKIDNSTNEWLRYFPSDFTICRDLSNKDKSTWSPGFSNESVFCMDEWGDGSVQLTPQIYQWDDGNNNDYDGCSKDWKIENFYDWDIITDLNNKSYWYLKWGNGKHDPTNGEAWDDGNESSGDGWEDDWTMNTGFKCINYSDKPSFWYPNWGDGIRDSFPTVEDWDDGNNMDDDGCSKECKVEPTYICTPNGSGVDEWTTIYPRPIVVSNELDTTLSIIKIKFDQEMYEYSIKDGDVDLYMDGPNSPYFLSWTSKFENDTFTVSYSVSPSILGGIGESIKLVLANIKAFKSINLIPMSSPLTFDYSFGALEASAGTQTGGKGASYTFIFTILLSIGISLLTGGSMELMWSMANTLQLIFFLGLLDLYYSSDLKAVFGFMKYSNFENPLSGYITKYIAGFASFVHSPVNSQFGDLGFESTNIILNSFDKILFVWMLVVIALILTFLVRCSKKKRNWFGRVIKRMDSSVRYESMTRFFVEIMLVVSIAAFINITFGSFANIEDIVSYSLACLALFLILWLTVYSIVYPMVNIESIRKFPDFHERHWLLFLEFKTKNSKCLFHYAYFLVRRLLFSFVLVCMKDFPRNQIVLILLMWICIAGYQVYLQPFKDTLQNVLASFNEIILVVFWGMLFSFLRSDNPKQLKVNSNYHT